MKKLSRQKTVAVLLFMLFMVSPLITNGGDYIIGEGDTLTISVWGNRDLSLSVKVRPDGKITLPAAGDIEAASLTPTQLRDAIAEKLRGMMKSPVVTVIVSEITNNKVYIFGGGVAPGVYSLTQRTTLLQLLCQIGQQPQAQEGVAAPSIMAASGGARNADLKNAYLLRRGQKIKTDFYSLFINGKVSDDILIEPNDAIFIPALGVEKNVYVIGAVTTPRFIIYRDGLTVMEAILEAGGFTRFASENSTVIFRKEGNKNLTIAAKLNRLIKDGDLSQNLILKPGDYVIVKESLL